MQNENNMDFERDFLPIWEESPEVYYNPQILEAELEQMRKENADLRYQCKEVEEHNQMLRTEMTKKDKEKTELVSFNKKNTIQLPIYQAKVLELNKLVSKLNADNKNVLLINNISKEKRGELEKKYTDVMNINSALAIKIQQLEKNQAKCKLEKAQEHKEKLRTKAENDKTKAKADDLEIQNKIFKEQISHHAEELRSKEILAVGMTRDYQILATKNENALMKLNDLEKHVIVLEKKIKTMTKECSESILKYSSLNHENISLKKKLDEAVDLQTANEELKAREQGVYRQMKYISRNIQAVQTENKKLMEIVTQLEKQKTKYIFVGEDISVIKRKLEDCMKQNLIFSNKFSNLDCPFYQSKYGKVEDTDSKAKYGPIKPSQYENKIFALEQVIKNLHLKYEIQEKKQLQYRDVVVQSLYDTKNAEQLEQEARTLLEQQKYQIIYDKLEILSKDSKIQKLEIQKNDCDGQCKLLNRQSTLLCRQLRNENKKKESMRRDIIRANKILECVEQKKEELQIKNEQSEKCKKIMQKQLENNNKNKKLQQLEANKTKSTIEEFQKKINKIQEELNIKSKNIAELTHAINKFKTEGELNKKIQSKDLSDAKNEIGKLTILNNTLIFKNNCLSKLKSDNTMLQSKLKATEGDLAYLQKKFDKLYCEKERNIHLNRMPKL